MLLHINSITGVGLGREAFQVYGGDGTAENPWRLIALGDSASDLRIVDDEASSFSVFPIDTPASPPTGFSPTGDKVRVKPNPHQFDVYPSTPTGTLDLGTTYEAITWIWGSCSLLGPEPFALLYVVGKDGSPDRWFFAVPDEIVELITKNPLFP